MKLSVHLRKIRNVEDIFSKTNGEPEQLQEPIILGS